MALCARGDGPSAVRKLQDGCALAEAANVTNMIVLKNVAKT